MEDHSKKESKLVNERKEKIKSLFSNPGKSLLVILMIFVIIFYFYYFFKVGNQPIWWDEGDYLSISKIWADGMDRPEWWGHFTLIRPLTLPLIWAAFFKLGLGESALRFFSELLPAILSIFLIYFIGKKMFNERIGLIAAFLTSINWVFLFYSFRLLTDLPSLLFSALSLYYFWVKYESVYLKTGKAKPKYLWLAIAFGIISALIRYPSGLNLVAIALYLLITRKLSLFKDKNMWIGALIGLLVLSPFFLYNYSNQGSIFPAFGFYHTGGGSGDSSLFKPQAFSSMILHINNFFMMFNLILFLVGFVLVLELFFYADKVWLQKERSKNQHLLLFFGLMLPFIYLIMFTLGVDARYFIALAPQIFIVCALGVDFLGVKGNTMLRQKNAYAVVVIILLVVVSLQQIPAGKAFLESRSDSYLGVKQAGVWLRENTPQDSRIITASITQNQYYSERRSDSFISDNDLWRSCKGSNGMLSTTEECQTKTREGFESKVLELNPDYLVLSVFEPGFTPQWANSYIQDNGLIPVQAYPIGSQQPMIIIFQYPAQESQITNFNDLISDEVIEAEDSSEALESSNSE